MLKIIDYPMNPDGKGVEGFQFPLLTPNGSCLHNITLGKPKGDQIRRDIELTPFAGLVRDHLLSLPGLEEVALYEHWIGLGRNVFIGRSPALSWEELWDATKPYFAELSRAEPKKDVLEQTIADARRHLDHPVFLVEWFSHATHCFAVHVRKPLTKCTIFKLGEYDTSDEPFQALFEFIAEDVGRAEVWIRPYSVSVHLLRGASNEVVREAVTKVVNLLGSTLCSNQSVSLRERVTVPCIDDDFSDWDSLDEPFEEE